MSVMALEERKTWLPSGRPFEEHDLEAMPDDGHRYELIDGVLLVTPAPMTGHQVAQVHLTSDLHQACPDEYLVLCAPFDVRLAKDTVLQPDIVVARYDDLTPRNLPAPPVLAVEIRSPSTAAVDQTLKRATYERFGVASYWLVDPDPDKPTVTGLELEDGRYVERAVVIGDEPFEVSQPFPFRVCAAELTRRIPRG